MTDARTLVRLLTWLSPAFPVGSFGYSHGLEQVIADGAIRDGATLFDWLSALLEHGAGWNDAVLLKEAYGAAAAGDDARLREVSDLALAVAPSAERLGETKAQGDAFLAAVRTWAAGAGEAAPTFSQGAYPIAVGYGAALRALPLSDVLPAWLHAFTSNLVSIAMRAVPLGQTVGLAVLARLEPVVLRVASRASTSTLDDLGGCAFLSDIASMRHETLQTRLFIS